MRNCLIIGGFILCLIGSQFLLVDKIVLHDGVMAPADPAAAGIDDSRQRHIDLPDAGGFALVATGVICLLFSIGLKRFKDK